MAMSPRLLRPRASRSVAGYDAAAAAYFLAVEAADGQALETQVKTAINSFVVGCKADGIWSAIKASCILMGARTLSGALTPLVGSEPTNVNFVSGDYSRRTGLVGNGTTKYLNTNRNNNADPQNSHHSALYRSASDTRSGSYFFMAAGTGTDGGRTAISASYLTGTDGLAFRSRSVLANSDGSNVATSSAQSSGLFAMSRTSSTNVNWIAGSASGSFSRSSETPYNGNVGVFASASGSTGTIGHSQNRFAFYSIGESLNLALLDSRVTTLYNAIHAAAWDATADADAKAYVAAVEAADGQTLEPAVKEAINTFVVGCKSDGIWSAIKSSCLLMGARTLAGALTPLVGTAPTNNNFVSGDYNRKTGLVGNRSTKWLNTNRANSADPQDSNHNAVYVSAVGTNDATANALIASAGLSTLSGSNVILHNTGSGVFFRNRNSSGRGFEPAQNPAAGFFGMRRSSSVSFVFRANAQEATVTDVSQAPDSNNVVLFRRNDNSSPIYSDARIAFYSVGESLTLTTLESRVTTLYNAIGAAIP